MTKSRLSKIGILKGIRNIKIYWNLPLTYFDKIITKIDESLEYTKSLEARVGRAKFLDSKGVGVIDPGAYSTSIILKEFFKEINNEKNN